MIPRSRVFVSPPLWGGSKDKKVTTIMNIKAIAAAAALAAAGIPVAAPAQTTYAPVSIVRTAIEPQVADAALFQQGFVAYAFVNTSAVPATEVDFALVGNGESLATLRDVGTFAKGVTIDRFVATPAAARNEALTVAKVTFADGAVWTNDAVAPHAVLQTADVSLIDAF